jgi:hypothetical protein
MSCARKDVRIWLPVEAHGRRRGLESYWDGCAYVV